MVRARQLLPVVEHSDKGYTCTTYTKERKISKHSESVNELILI